MPYDVYDLPMQTALGGNEDCESCAALVADVTFEPCNATRALDADDVLFGYLKCDTVFTLNGTDPLTEVAPNPTAVQPFTDAVTAGDVVVRKTQDFEKPEAEAITRALSAYDPEDAIKYRQSFTWKDTRRLADASEAKLMNQILQWSNAGILQCFYVTKNDDVFMYRNNTKLQAKHMQAPGQESIEEYMFTAEVIIPANALIVPFRIAGLYKALAAVSL